jgi:hypothetical protein
VQAAHDRSGAARLLAERHLVHRHVVRRVRAAGQREGQRQQRHGRCRAHRHHRGDQHGAGQPGRPHQSEPAGQQRDRRTADEAADPAAGQGEAEVRGGRVHGGGDLREAGEQAREAHAVDGEHDRDPEDAGSVAAARGARSGHGATLPAGGAG